jgi:hypothetical protein
MFCNTVLPRASGAQRLTSPSSNQPSAALRTGGRNIYNWWLCRSLLQVSPAGYNLTTVAVDGTVIVAPKRSQHVC